MLIVRGLGVASGSWDMDPAAPVRAFTQRKASLFFSRRAATPQSVPADSQEDWVWQLVREA